MLGQCNRHSNLRCSPARNNDRGPGHNEFLRLKNFTEHQRLQRRFISAGTFCSQQFLSHLQNTWKALQALLPKDRLVLHSWFWNFSEVCPWVSFLMHNHKMGEIGFHCQPDRQISSSRIRVLVTVSDKNTLTSYIK